MEGALSAVRVKYPALLARIPELKAEQVEVIEAVIATGMDTFANLPTGFGKSLTYVLCPLIADQLEKDVQHISVVVSPLLTIISEQVAKLQAVGISAHPITSESDVTTINAVRTGNTQIIFITPECAASRSWRETFQLLVDRICVLCIDEAHCISTWGKTFRKVYRKVAELCSYITCPVLFLTGTATRDVQCDVLGLFGIDSFVTVSRTPDRDNMRLFVTYTTHTMVRLQWLLDHYKQHGVHGKKTLLFATNIDEARKLYWWMLDELDKAGKAYTGDINCVDDRIVDMYHAHVSADCDERTRTEFPKATSTVRLLISTIKMGMGVDIADIDVVVLFGAPSDIIDLWQELGRCARGQGRRGLAVVYLTGRTMTDCKDKQLNALREQEECFRRTILDSFRLENGMDEDVVMENLCAGDCVNICQCSLCKCCNFCGMSCVCMASKADLNIVMESP